MDIQSLLPFAIKAAEEASRAILEVYHSGDFQTEAKGDLSPLTLADKRAHQKISEVLQPLGLPMLSEEGKLIPYEERRQWEYFWMVDPLDGTKEFIKRNGEFTVNIALIHVNRPVLGVVEVPVTRELFYSTVSQGAWKKNNEAIEKLDQRLPVDQRKPGIRVVASKSHMNTETEAFISTLKEPRLISAGSSLKFLLLATGEADLYPRYAPTMEWDTAAAHAILNEVGLKVLQHNKSEELAYNKEALLNPYFLAG